MLANFDVDRALLPGQVEAAIGATTVDVAAFGSIFVGSILTVTGEEKAVICHDDGGSAQGAREADGGDDGGRGKVQRRGIEQTGAALQGDAACPASDCGRGGECELAREHGVWGFAGSREHDGREERKMGGRRWGRIGVGWALGPSSKVTCPRLDCERHSPDVHHVILYALHFVSTVHRATTSNGTDTWQALLVTSRRPHPQP
ncbi:unnamed protein product [Chondrus crispus]|uniref:Uncharacterized protein n=1 Tax=Chondrus crispus TaxID=2769 RepID=R7QFC3_CHOCR|nr:unnamed protein product [Chondrus crispus]CDF37227.1 unnamed protein product [Chondrus crispus]|eukprot:XP_005717046.1 unnamed protein product [Chondrus crispus]